MGWQSERDSQQVELPVYDQKGKQAGTTRRMVYWTVFHRRTAYSLSAGFSIETAVPGAPAPSARASAAESSEAAYATWHGEREGVPADVLNLPSSPTNPQTRETLTAECASRVARELGRRLFMAYK